MAELVTADMIEDLATGSAFLGTGGGGDPYIGALLCRAVLEKHGPVRLLPLEALGDEDAVFTAAAMGAPTVLVEKLLSVEDADFAVSALERHLGRTATAIIAAEVGGINSTLPVAYAALRGLPLVDGDGMGRAFPSLHMTTFNTAGIGCAPLALADEWGETVIIDTPTAARAEALARPLVASLGASATLSCYPMSGREAKRAAVSGSISAALEIGALLRRGDDERGPVDRLVEWLEAAPLYGGARRLFVGKIVGVERDTSRGWVFGTCELESLDGSEKAKIVFQNENLCLTIEGAMRAIVPDLITIVDQETGRAIPTESLRYGQRVAVIGCRAPAPLRSDEGLAAMGPAAFGLLERYRPLDTIEAEGREPAGSQQDG